jgi:cobalt-zinc-cadmium efflux system outer membrane protein
MRLTGEQAAQADSLLGLAERRLAVGDISVLDRDQLAHEAAVAHLVALQAREAASAARVELGRATGSSLEEPPYPAGSLSDGLGWDGEERESVAIDSVGPLNVDQMPALRGALADSAAASARLRSARWAMLPVPALIAEREWDYEGAPRGPTRLGFSIPIPLWSQGRERVAEARGDAIAKAANAAEARLSAAATLQTARVRLEETTERARLAQQALQPAAIRVRENTIRLYAANEIGVLQVLEALRRERDSAQIVVQELLAFQQARADLIALLGGFE